MITLEITDKQMRDITALEQNRLSLLDTNDSLHIITK